MTQVLACTFTETGRSRLGLILGIVNWACILTSLGLLGVGAFIKLNIEQYTNLVENYDGDSLPYLLIAIGLASAVTNVIGGFSCVILSDPKKRQTYRFMLVGYLVSALCVSLSVLAGGILCYTHISHLKESFQGGLMSAFNAYKDNMALKEEVDKLQMNFKCCGNNQYTDWFKILWMPEEYKKLHHSLTLSEDSYLHDDVPFSCCDARASRPCIHYKIHENSAHENYDYTSQLTINKPGCQDALMEYFGDEVLVNTRAFVFAVFVLQLIVLVLVRYLQTSIFEALAKEDPEAPSKGYLLTFGDQPAEGATKGSEHTVQMDGEDYPEDEFDPLPNEHDPLLSRTSVKGQSSRGGSLAQRAPLPLPRPGFSQQTQNTLPQSHHTIGQQPSDPDYMNYAPQQHSQYAVNNGKSRSSQYMDGSNMYAAMTGYRTSGTNMPPPPPPLPTQW